jgi:hypothetical protein
LISAYSCFGALSVRAAYSGDPAALVTTHGSAD